ncbi:class A beta-lactamase [Uliginosibacterium sp. H3]|uniref:Beta-lactamase n=1 Tax=Uliginosibacterium silvisoli TaxID=3114758 RepID=A0ABU6K2G8_9RHOO|nr:class A beta-lactamase [Uliginosibacterium sp. H3]
MINRRQFLGSAIIPLATLPFATYPLIGLAADDIVTRLHKIETSTRGRLGVCLVDSGSGKRAGLRLDERFPMCSTFKFLAAAYVLSRVDAGKEQLERRIAFTEQDLQAYSPGTKDHVGGAGLSVAALCEAAITLSDNTAANLLLASFGGPAGLTGWLRASGDKLTRLDRNEPSLNEARPGDPRDTTTPAAMADTMKKILLGDLLAPGSRATLLRWLDATQTGNARIRAGVPPGWLVGDKTGTGDRGTSNDIAIIRPPGRAPILLSVYLTGAKVPGPQRDLAIADVARLISGWLEG